MIRVVLLTDSHGAFTDVYNIIEREKPDKIIFTGDGISQIKELSYVFSDVDFHMVKGNCDIFERERNEIEIFDLAGKKVMITHGHLFGVKRKMELLERVAEENGVNIVCFGHTHKEYELEKNKIIYFNPGAFEDGKYAILSIENDMVSFERKQI